MAFSLFASQIWRRYNTDGDSGSGPYKPRKEYIRDWGTEVEAQLGKSTRHGTSLVAAQADTGLLAGNVVATPEGHWLVVASGALAEGPGVVAHGSLALLLVLEPTARLPDMSDLVTDTRDYSVFYEGLELEVGAHMFRVLSAGASGWDCQNAAGVKFRYLVQKGVIDIRGFRSATEPETGNWPDTWDAAFARAVVRSEAMGFKPIYFPPNGNSYVFEESWGNLPRLAITGDVSERARSALTTTSGWNRAVIEWAPASASDWLLDCYETTDPTKFIGPFRFENVAFKLGGKGFRLGRRDVALDGNDDTVTDGAGQRYVFGAWFDGCALENTVTVDREHDSNNVLTFSDQVLIEMAKAFESGVKDTSLAGGGTQIKFYGCDRPVVENVRGGRCQIGMVIEASGTFTVEHVVQNYQCEGFTLAGIVNHGAVLTVVNARLEAQGGTYEGMQTLAETLNVSAGTANATAGDSWEGKVFPNVSVLKVEHSTTGEVFWALVADENGSLITLEQSDYFEVPYSDSVADVSVANGYGILSSGNHDCSVIGGSINPANDSPALVYVAGRGAMSVTGLKRQKGNDSNPIGTVVIGNKAGVLNYLNPRVSFTGCTPNVCGEETHPFVTIADMGRARSSDGQAYATSMRSNYESLTDELTRSLQRTWLFTPKNSATSTSGSGEILLTQQEIDTVTGEVAWCWKKAAGDLLICRDETLPSSELGARVRVRILAKGRSSGQNLDFYYGDNGASSTTSITGISTDFAIYERVLVVPTVWEALGAQARGIFFPANANTNVDIAAVSVELLGDAGGYVTGSYQFPLRMGGRVLWWDGSGNLRAKVTEGLPANATDGTIISAATVT